MQKTFSDKVEAWYIRFDRMLPGEAIDINKSGKRDIELFVDMCKNYVDQGHNDFQFSDDYQLFKRVNPCF